MNWGQGKGQQLRELLYYAKTNSVFYRKWLNDFNFESLTPESYSKVPILNKKELIGKEQFMLTIPHTEGVKYEFTSGSTGTPLVCYKGSKELLIKGRDLWRLRGMQGKITPKDKYAMFYAFTEDNLKTDKIQQVDQVTYLSMLDMSPATLDEYYQVLLERQPAWLLGVPSALQILANYITSRGYRTDILGIRYIEANGEMLFDYQREAIEKAFGPILYNHYGCREFWCLAMSCEKGNLHVLQDKFYYEVVDSDENGMGELVVTDLTNKTWPLIRYNLGDLVHEKMTTCTCGNHNPVITISGGRSQEYIQIGEWIANPILFHYAVIKTNRNYGDTIRQFKVIQKSEYQVNVDFVRGNDFSRNALEELCHDIKSKLPQETELNLRVVEEIPHHNKKFKYFTTYRTRSVDVGYSGKNIGINS